jgi:SulP family sulfate permease
MGGDPLLSGRSGVGGAPKSGRRAPWAGLRRDAVAGAVLGVESVPDGLATGLLAGVNPLAGVYGYMVGTVTGALATSSAYMAVQGTGAMAIIVADVPAVHHGHDPPRALFTLAMLTGVAMVVAGVLRLGGVLRFVSNAVMVGFINAVGVNIVLGQLESLTGYSSDQSSRVTRALDTVLHPGRLDGRSVVVGVVTIGLILLLERTPLGPLGMVVAVFVTSAGAGALGWSVAQVKDLGATLGTLPRLQAPDLRLVPTLVVPALSLALVGLVQGAGISANFPNEDGTYPDASRDFVGQGVANLASGALQGMPVGGSVSASSLNKAAGAQSRISLVVAGGVMAVIVVAFGDLIGAIAMPALAGLLILVGARTIRPADLASVWRTGTAQRVVLAATFMLTLVVPLQYAVLVGVGLSIVLYVIGQSNTVRIRQRIFTDDGPIETDPPEELGGDEVVVLQPYGSLFFAAAPIFEEALPQVTARSRNSVVILRLRERTDLGTTFTDVLQRYAHSLRDVHSKLVIVSVNDRLADQLRVTGLTDLLGPENLYRGSERIGASLEHAHRDAVTWVAQQAQSDDGNDR